MSGVWGWFGGGAAQKRKDSPKNAILGLRAQLEMLQKREKHLQSQIDESTNVAKKNVASNNKQAAMAAIKRKKNIEQQLGQTQGQIGTLEHQINAIESANINRETLAAMQKASEAMKSIHGKLNPDKVDEIMDQIREQNALSDEISRTMVDVSLANEVDETELEDELEQLQQEQLDEQMLGTGTVPVSDAVNRMPAAANGELKGKTPIAEEDDEEAELRKLQAEMAM